MLNPNVTWFMISNGVFPPPALVAKQIKLIRAEAPSGEAVVIDDAAETESDEKMTLIIPDIAQKIDRLDYDTFEIFMWTKQVYMDDDGNFSFLFDAFLPDDTLYNMPAVTDWLNLSDAKTWVRGLVAAVELSKGVFNEEEAACFNNDRNAALLLVE